MSLLVDSAGARVTGIIMRFSRAECKVLHVGQDNPRCVYRLKKVTERSPSLWRRTWVFW